VAGGCELRGRWLGRAFARPKNCGRNNDGQLACRCPDLVKLLVAETARTPVGVGIPNTD